MLQAVADGGIERLTAVQADATALPFAGTALEVLEHIPDGEAAVREVTRVASRQVVVSVPSHADENPEHLHLLRPSDLERLFLRAGARRVGFQQVPNHLIAVITVGS